MAHLIIVSLHNVHIWRDRAQVLVCFPVADISGAEDLLDLARNKKLLELQREIMDSVGNVQVANDEHEDHG